MAETRDPDSEHSPYMRLPWPAVALGLFVLVAGVLGVGVYANENLRSRAAPQSAPAVIVATTETPVAALATVTVPSALILVASTATAIPSNTPTMATAMSAPAVASATPASPTIAPQLTAEVTDAYQRYWQVRAEALFDLDAARLSEVMAGEHLASAEKLIKELQSEGHAIRTDVDHHYVVLKATIDEAVIADSYTDGSVYVDQKTHEALSIPANDMLAEQYRMNRINGAWKVVSLVRAS